MSFLCWHVRRRAILVDDIIQNLGILIASKCHYCINAKQESIHHIFCEGEGPREVWLFFAQACRIRLPQIRIWDGMMAYWRARASGITQVGWIRGILPIIIYLELWKAR